MMKSFRSPVSFEYLASFVVLSVLAASAPLLVGQQTGPQQLAFAGLRSTLQQGQFNAVATDAAGDIYLLLNQDDGVRLLKTNAAATSVLAQADLGAAGDIGLAMALDPSGNVYVTGTSTSGSLAGTSGAAFHGPVGTTVNSFVAGFDTSLNVRFVTFGGSGRTAASSIAATPDAVFITGLIYGNGLPVTPSGIIQTPAYGSNQNGFVEKFSTNGSTLLYATYLSGAIGDTTPMAITADTADNAYIGGFTTATGFPTISALVPRSNAPTAGFLTKLTPAGDGITFSTFIPGAGVSSLAVDPVTNTLLLTGTIALGQFPVVTAPAPLVNLPYQVLLRMPLDGSAVLSSTVIAPGIQSVLATAAGAVWVNGILSVPLLPLTPLADTGSGFAVRVMPGGSQGGTTIDQVARFGGAVATNPNYATLPLTLTSLAVDDSGAAIVAGSIAPTTSSALLATQTFDLALANAPTSVLPSAIHDAVPAPASCPNSSLCSGSAAYLARVIPTAAASLALSTDTSPVIVLRNLGSTPATGLSVTTSGFTLTSTCGTTLAAGDECTALLSGAGPGSISAQAANAITQTATLAAIPAGTVPDTIVFSPKELDFGIQTATSPILTRVITVTNLGATPETFISALNGTAGRTPYTFAEVASDCVIAGLASTKQLAAGATCHITLGFTASTNPGNDGAALAYWTVGGSSVVLTGYAQAASLSLSSTAIDFGTQFSGGLSSLRYLYLSNSSSATIAHTAIALPATSPFSVTDTCPVELEPHSICQLQIAYHAFTTTSSDSVTLNLDQGLTAEVTGKTIPQPADSGSTVNPSLSVTPGLITFTNAVAVTGISSTSQTVTVQNTGTSVFALSFTVTGDFTDQTNCTGSLAGGASCSIVFTFAPAQPGPRSGLLAVTAGAGTTPAYVTLNGTGTPILPANNGTLDFGNVPLGQPVVQWYKVSQPFTSLTAGTLTSTFGVVLVEDIGYGHGDLPASSFLTATTGSCLNCWLGVQFTPSTGGAQSATLALASNLAGNPYTLALTGNGVALAGVVLTPVNQDFGTIGVHSSSAPVLFTLTNVTPGSVPITVDAPVLTGDFSLSTAPNGGTPCNGPLATNASCFVQVFFAPTATGQRTGTLTLQTSAGTVTAALTGFGSPDQGISFTPAALVFNNVPGVTATQQTITVLNTGGGTLQVGAPSNANPAFTPTSACATLAPAATCTLTVTYAPASATSTDALQLPVTAVVGGSPIVTTYSLPLTATYTSESSGLQILPATANFGPAPVNALGGTRIFTINNLTAKSLALAITLPREFVLIGPACAGLAPNASCSFSVSFLPLTNGAITGTLFAQATPTDGSATINGLGIVQGYGTGTNTLAVTGSIQPGRLVNFGQVPSGQSVQQVLTLTNTSSATVATTTSTITIRRITSLWPFLSTTTCGTTLAIDQSCTITISYTPLNQVATGTGSPAPTTDGGTLTIESDAVSAPDLIDLTGTAGSAAVAAPANNAPLVAFTASQNSFTFATTPIGFSSAPQFATLANTGNTVVHVANFTASPDFTVTGNCVTLVPGASCLLTITFAPQISTLPAGARIGAVEISSDSSTSLEFLSLLGTASPSTLVFAPAALNFGAALVGGTTALPILITNAGTTPAIFNGIAATGDYAATGTCPGVGGALAPNASCTITASFTPTTTGVRAGTLALASSVSSAPLTAVLTGVGVQSHLLLNPTALNFSSTVIGSSASLSMTLANTGTASISGIAFAVAGDYAVTAPCSFTTLSAGASCSVTVAFTPTKSGVRAGVLTVSSSDPTSPDTVALTGTGTSTAIPSTSSFTLTVDGGASSSQTVQQTRPATYALTVTPIGGYTGTVILACNAVTAAPDAVCSMLPATIALSGTSQTASVTINTVTSARLRAPGKGGAHETMTLCILVPSALFFWGMRKRLAKRRIALFLALFYYSTMMFMISGCGSGGDPNLRLTPSGNYQYTVTANSTNGTPLTQTVTLNLIIP